MSVSEVLRIVAEEKWSADGHTISRDTHWRTIGSIYFSYAHARIAACAPEALSFMLDNEYGGYDVTDGPLCLDCGALKDAEHSVNCRWLAIMKKAGLR